MKTILKKATCRIDCGGEIGTGFFVNDKTIITARHVIGKFISVSENVKDIIIDNLSNHSEKVACTYIAHCDDAGVAIISIDGDYRNDNYLTLCASEIVEEESIKSYGYPNSVDGRLVGELLIGKVLTTISDSDETMHDVSINIDNFVQGTYGGFSGSPVMNQDKVVTSFITDQNTRYLSAVSIKKVATFLRNQSIAVKPDYLASFKEYEDLTFDGFGRIKSACIGVSKKPLANTNPQEIIVSCKGKIFYPSKDNSLPELIADIKRNKDIKDALLSGWLELLTYIELLKGTYKDFNHIQIEVTSEEIDKKFKIIPTSKKIISKVHINFFFTENKDYFEISKEYIHEHLLSSSVIMDTCNVFNSHNKNFGLENLTSRDIIPNISEPENSGPTIKKAKIRALSLHNLRERIINSSDIESAQLNLIKRFEDALK